MEDKEKTKQVTQRQSLTTSHEQTDAQAVPEQNMANLHKATLLLSEHDIICVWNISLSVWVTCLAVPPPSPLLNPSHLPGGQSEKWGRPSGCASTA